MPERGQGDALRWKIEEVARLGFRGEERLDLAS
jgi:hypothetical protein